MTIPTERVLEIAHRVCAEYRARGWSLTLRGLYYQAVVRKLVPSDGAVYERFKVVLSRERLRGGFPLNALVDRTRYVRPGVATRCDTKVDNALIRAAEAVKRLPDKYLHRDMWFGQPVHVSVWFEKDALAGVFEPVCRELGVSCFSCRGDPSHASLYEWLVGAGRIHGIDNEAGWRDSAGAFHRGMAKRSVVLYFGDHDPTGIRIPETAERTVRTFMGLSERPFPLEFRRIGITLEQALERDLPPFPAKQTSADFDKYCERFGVEDAWELDALSPDDTVDMVRSSVGEYFDATLYARLHKQINKRRATMRQLMRTRDWFDAATAIGEED